jgi:hypothetical protein
LFFCFDTTVWKEGTSKEKEDNLALRTGALSPEDALTFYNQMIATASGGPTLFSMHPPLSLRFRGGATEVDPVADGPGGLVKGKGKGKGKAKGRKKANLTGETFPAEGAGEKAEPNSKPQKKVAIETHFKVMTKVLDESANIDRLINEVNEKAGGAPFAALMLDHKIKIGALYESMRLATMGTSPNMDCRWG